MKKIHSFEIDHFDHDKGFYLSTVQGDVVTYDLRFKTPNGGDYISPEASHTIEHLLATTYRNSELKESVLYFGPMGCRTGFYLLLRNIKRDDAINLTVDCIKKALLIEDIPGNTAKECGNYKEHDLTLARIELESYLKVLSKIV